MPTCPEWALCDPARHIGEGRHPTAQPAPEDAPAEPREREAPPARPAPTAAAGPAGTPPSPPERRRRPPPAPGDRAPHHDAHLTAGAAQPLPEDVALDGVDEFLTSRNPVDALKLDGDPRVLDPRAAWDRDA
ncbi:hypothetical protein ACGF13_26170 [Kitasatospora sp. NPDC048286]|uniref:hypothetical protein n=1 Tax=Kitasatospora sp. NPDC048286 TaxID=3364047 RepID=UPI00371AF96F